MKCVNLNTDNKELDLKNQQKIIRYQETTYIEHQESEQHGDTFTCKDKESAKSKDLVRDNIENQEIVNNINLTEQGDFNSKAAADLDSPDSKLNKKENENNEETPKTNETQKNEDEEIENSLLRHFENQTEYEGNTLDKETDFDNDKALEKNYESFNYIGNANAEKNEESVDDIAKKNSPSHFVDFIDQEITDYKDGSHFDDEDHLFPSPPPPLTISTTVSPTTPPSQPLQNSPLPPQLSPPSPQFQSTPPPSPSPPPSPPPSQHYLPPTPSPLSPPIPPPPSQTQPSLPPSPSQPPLAPLPLPPPPPPRPDCSTTRPKHPLHTGAEPDLHKDLLDELKNFTKGGGRKNKVRSDGVQITITLPKPIVKDKISNTQVASILSENVQSIVDKPDKVPNSVSTIIDKPEDFPKRISLVIDTPENAPENAKVLLNQMNSQPQINSETLNLEESKSKPQLSENSSSSIALKDRSVESDAKLQGTCSSLKVTKYIDSASSELERRRNLRKQGTCTC